MLFLTFSNTNIQFAKKKLIWRSYITIKALSTVKWVEFIDNKKFIKAALDAESKTFVMHILALEVLLSEITIHLSRTA